MGGRIQDHVVGQAFALDAPCLIPASLFPQEFFLDLIFAPVENSPAPPSENADGTEAGKDVRETAATDSATESETASAQGDAAAGVKEQDSGIETPATRETPSMQLWVAYPSSGSKWYLMTRLALVLFCPMGVFICPFS